MTKKDFSQIAFAVVQQATGEAPKPPLKTAKQEAGRKGGLTGGKNRMATLTPEQRSALGKQARESRTAKEALASVEASAKANQLNKVN